MLMDRCGGDDSAVLVAAVWPLILTGEHRQRIYSLFNNAVLRLTASDLPFIITGVPYSTGSGLSTSSSGLMIT